MRKQPAALSVVCANGARPFASFVLIDTPQPTHNLITKQEVILVIKLMGTLCCKMKGVALFLSVTSSCAPFLSKTSTVFSCDS